MKKLDLERAEKHYFHLIGELAFNPLSENALRVKERLARIVIPNLSRYKPLLVLRALSQIPDFPVIDTLTKRNKSCEVIEAEVAATLPPTDDDSAFRWGTEQACLFFESFDSPQKALQTAVPIAIDAAASEMSKGTTVIKSAVALARAAYALYTPPLRFSELSKDYGDLSKIAKENVLLGDLLEKVGHTLFKQTIHTSPKTSSFTTVVPKEMGDQMYVQERVSDSFRALLCESEVRCDYSWSGENIAVALSPLRESLLKLQRSVESDALSLANKYSVFQVDLELLRSIALEAAPEKNLSARIGCTESTARLIIARTLHGALYSTYLRRLDSILDLYQDETPAEKIAPLFFEKKNYKLTAEVDPRYAISCLIFEANTGMWLRLLQAKQMKKATSESERSVVIEMIPGSGKTAFGMVIDLHNTWTPGKVPIAVFPKELITSMKKELAERYKKVTGRSTYCVSVDRSKETAASLRHLLQRMETSRDVGDVLLTTKEDIQALELLFIECVHIIASNKSSSSESMKASSLFPILQKILHLASLSHSCVDECHELLSPDEVEKYPLGDKARLETDVILSVESVFGALLETGLFPLTPEKLIEGLESCVDILLEKMKKSLGSLFEEARSFILSKEHAASLSLQSSPQYAKLSMIRGTLLTLLPNALTEKIHSEYGLSHENNDYHFVIPYSGNNTPIEGAIFESPHETLIKTYLFYLQNGLNTDQCASLYFELLRINKSTADKLKIPHEETLSYLYFEKHLKGKNWTHLPEAAILYVTLVAANEITHYKQSIESTSMNFASLFAASQFFSGTIYNKSTYPSNVAYCRNESTTAETLSTVAAAFAEKGTLTKLPLANPQLAFIENVVLDPTCMMAIDLGALFNGIQNETVAKMLAEKLKKTRTDIEYVLFFDGKNELSALTVQSGAIAKYNKYTTPPFKRFTYLDQVHTFGVDVSQITGAGSRITVGKNTLAQYEQACWRMRGLKALGQYISFDILPEAAESMEKMDLPLSLEGMVTYLTINEHEKLKPATLQATLHAIQDSLREILLQKMKTEPLSFSLNVLEEFPDLFLQKSAFSPEILYGHSEKKIATLEYIEEKKQLTSSLIHATGLLTAQEKRQALQKIEDLSPSVISEYTSISAGSTRKMPGLRTKLRMAEKQKTTEKELEVTKVHQKNLEYLYQSPPESIRRKIEPFIPWPEISLDSLDWLTDTTSPLAIASLKEIAKSSGNKDWEVFAHFLDNSMYVSENTLSFKSNGWSFSAFTDALYFSEKPKTWSREIIDVLVAYDSVSGRFATLGLSLADSLHWENLLSETKCFGNISYALIKPEGSFLIDETAHGEAMQECIASKAVQAALTKWRLFNVGSSFSIEDFSLLKDLSEEAIADGISMSSLLDSVSKVSVIRAGNEHGKELSTKIDWLLSEKTASTLFYE